MKPEEWRPIEGYEGSYEVSDQGRVRSLSRYIFRLGRNGELHTMYKPASLIKLGLRGMYLKVVLCGPTDKVQVSVHRLVAQAFLGDIYDQVNHKNEDKLDNRLSNLELCTGSYNQCYTNGRLLVFQSPSGEVVTVKGARVAAKVLPISRSSIRALLLGERDNCKGWRLLQSNA